MSENKNKLAIDKITTNINKSIDTKMRTATFNKTYKGIITDVKFDDETSINDNDYNKYTVRFNNIERDFIINDGKFHSVGENVIVHVPNNILTDRYVECNNNSSHPLTIIYNNEDDTITELWDNNLSRTFSFTVENKGTADEKVTTMIFPDGSVMNIEGF